MLPEGPFVLGPSWEDRPAWEKVARQASSLAILDKAKKTVEEPMPELSDDLYLEFSRSGNRTRWQEAAFRLRGRIRLFALAECLEGQGRFVRPFEETVAVLDRERTWVIPAHDRSLANFRGTATDIDLGSAGLAAEMAMARQLLAGRLSQETRDRIERNVRRRVLDPFLRMLEGKAPQPWWLTTRNNWNAVCLAGVTAAALALEVPRDQRAQIVAAAERYIGNFLAGFTPDGYCSEGIGYWNYGFGHFVFLAELLRLATGGYIDWLNRPDAVPPATFPLHIRIVDQVYPAFSDCALGTTPSQDLLDYLAFRYGFAVPQPPARPLREASRTLGHWLLFTFHSPPPRAAQGVELNKGIEWRSWFDTAGILIGRPGPSNSCRMAVALKGGHNAEHHNHNDVGTFLVVVDGEALIVDPGAEVYTARTFSGRRYESRLLSSWGHAVPMIDGHLQQPGVRAAARVLRAEFSDRADTLVLDLHAAYPSEAGLKKLVRTFVFDRTGAGSLRMVDEVEMDQCRQFESALVTLGTYVPKEDGTFEIRGTKAVLRCRVRTDGVPWEAVVEPIPEDVMGGHRPVRIGLRTGACVQTLRMETTLTPADPIR